LLRQRRFLPLLCLGLPLTLRMRLSKITAVMPASGTGSGSCNQKEYENRCCNTSDRLV
jgi:hypothetical protein